MLLARRPWRAFFSSSSSSPCSPASRQAELSEVTFILPLRTISTSSACFSLASKNFTEQPLFMIDPKALTRRLETSLREQDTDQIWRSLQRLQRSGVDLSQQNPHLITHCLSLFASSDDELCLLRAHKVISRLSKEEKIDCVDGKVLASLSMAYAKMAMFDLSANAFRLVLQKHHYPSLSFWKSLLEMWAQNTRGAIYTIRVFLEICRYCSSHTSKSCFLKSKEEQSVKPEKVEKIGDKMGNISPGKEEKILNKMGHLPSVKSDSEALVASRAYDPTLDNFEKVEKIIDDQVDRFLLVKPDTEAFVVALKACASLDDAGKAEKVIDQMRHFSLSPDIACFCALMKAYEKGGRVENLCKVLVRMKQAQKVPDRATLNSLISSCINIGHLDIAAEVVLSWTGKIKDDVDIVRQDDNGRGNTPKTEEICNEIHDSIQEWRAFLEPPCAETYTLLLKGFFLKNKVANAAKFIAQLYRSGNSKYISCSLAIEGPLKHGLRDQIKCMLEVMAIENTPADSMSYGMLVKEYSKLPQPLKAEAVLQDACQVGHLLDIGSYVSIIDAYNLIQDYDSTQRIFRKMKCRGVTPLEPILDKLLAFFEKHDQPYMMLKLLNTSARDPPLKTELHHWNQTIQVFCKGKHVSDAKAIVKTMKQLGIDVDANTYVFLLSGYILMGNKANEIVLLWVEIKDKLSPIDGARPMQLTEELLNGFLAIFVKYGYFKNAMDVISKLEERSMWVDKEKYKGIYRNLHKRLYTSKHCSQERFGMSQERRGHVNAFKTWVGLPI